MDTVAVVPSPSLLVLVGSSGAGKSTWAAANFAPEQVVSSDRLRAIVGAGPDDLTASTDAFAVLETIVAHRLGRGLTTVVDTLGTDVERRRRWVAAARTAGVAPVAVVFDVPLAECRARNRARRVAVPERVLAQQRRAVADQRGLLAGEGFDLVLEPVAVRTAPAHVVRARAAITPAAVTPAAASPAGDRSLRFGLQLPVHALPGGPAELGARLATIGRAAEEAGFSSLWLMDHLRQIPMFGPPWSDLLEAWTTLGFLAAATSTIRLGTMVSPLTFRPVPLLAKIVATLDVLSGGRAACGLGLGWYEAEHRAAGLAFPSVPDRYALLEDALEALPLHWGPGAPAYDGRVLHLPDTLCYPRPLQAHVPILVGGGGERRTLALAAQHADAVNIVGEAEVLRRKGAVVRTHCEAIGRDPAEVELTQLSTTLVGRDGAEVTDLLDRTRPRRVGAERWATRTNAGTVDDQVARFAELARVGVRTAVVSLPDLGDTAAVERFAAVIEGVNRRTGRRPGEEATPT